MTGASAFAQADEEDEEETPPPAAVQDRVVVTGSLLRRDEFTSSSPIQVITAEAATLEGLIDTAEILQGASVAAGSTQINTQFGGFVIEGGVGVNTVSLRGLGSQRTLVVFNGRRLGPAGTQGQVGAVDLNVIPQSVVQRYEILKDGASSIYGSDALAGVINVITRRSIDRPELTVRGSVPFESGGANYSIDGAYGFNFDRGNITLSASYERFERLRRGDRDFLACGKDYMFDATTGERVDITALTPNAPGDIGNPICFNPFGNTFDAFGINLRGAGAALSSHYFVFDPDAAGKPGSGFIDGMRLIGNDNAQLGRWVVADLTGYREMEWNDPRTREADILPEVTRFSLYSTASFDVAGGELYGELLYNRRETKSRGIRQFFPRVMADHPFVENAFGPAMGNPFAGRPPVVQVAPGILVEEIDPIILVPSNQDTTVDYYYGVAGFTGDFGSDAGLLANWTYDVNVSYSRSDGSYDVTAINRNNVDDAARPGNQISHSFDAGGNIICTRADGSSCPVVNYLDPRVLRGDLTDEEFNFVFSSDKGTTIFEQTMVNALITGDVFELPAGPVGAAFGVQYREVSIDDTPGPLSISGTSWGRASAGRTAGTDRVWEAVAEVEVPIIRGVQLIEDLTFSGSIRYFDYQAFGSDYVYKLGANWQVNPLIRLRGTYGTSFRAPALFERFLADQTGFTAQSVDPCRNWGLSTNQTLRDNCAADGIPDDFNTSAPTFTTVRGGGSALTPETSDAMTFGFVFTPTELNLSVALDYFEIEVNDQITVLGASNILAACYGRPNFPNAFCDLIERNRDPASSTFLTLTRIQDDYVNINSQRTSGIDVTARYEHEFSFGRLVADFAGTWTFTDETDVFGGLDGFETNDFNGTIGDPDFVANSTLQFNRGDWTFSWFSRYVQRASNEDIVTAANPFTYLGRPNTLRKRHAETTIYHGASVRYQASDWQIIAGINNLFDEAPPAISSGAGSSRVGTAPIFGTQYDLRGRTGFVNVSRRF
ncbi:TonB-dependent receptor [Alkalicaulis satelles]|uniref:TonB-dependent receptor n=2 Tax=Alkalicaulis satelles TaxID=2609175 RepID=A0A5M6ZJD9_9PROT|nr:TonB-dependent receptor [Alkalicaulis satelles]